MGGIYEVEMGSDAIIYIASYVKIGWFSHSKVDKGENRHIYNMMIA
jgi:hypothetical protein